jgi:3-(3-hydroxy-phenyl)propionate hydroxylase
VNTTAAVVELVCDVAVIGCGPTGVVLANLLGASGLRVVVLERDDDVYPVPRATHVDSETMRNFALTGLIDAITPHTSPFGEAQIARADGVVLLRAPVEAADDTHGARGSCFLDQPELERALRAGLRRFSGVSLHTGVVVEGVAESGDQVQVRGTRAADGAPVCVHARWAVGCDGGRSVTRDVVGGGMESLAPPRRWVIVDTVLRDAADARLLPPAFRYVLTDERLTLYAHGHGLNRRWEFLLAEGEPDPDDATVRAWLAAQVDPSRVQVTRTATYAHRALVANRWRAGRVLLAGDAAHLMPPFAGQGMCSGVRDAVNLAWKLARVCGGASNTLLESYELERRAHVREVTRGALFLGDFVAADTPGRRLTRDLTLRAAPFLPGLHGWMRRMGSRNPALVGGLLMEGAPLAGRPRPSGRVRIRGRARTLDELCGYQASLWIRGAALDWRQGEGLAACGVQVMRVGDDVDDLDGTVARWLGREEFALVRPDRVVFAAGRASALDDTLRRYLAGIGASLSRAAA